MKIKEKIRKYKPGVKNSIHLISAAIFWTLIGTVLFLRGVCLLTQYDVLLLVLPGIIAGWLKSRLILDKTAAKNISRILKFRDGTCLGAVFSLKTWGVVLLMSLLGVATRHSSLSKEVIGFICVIIGFALVYSSRLAWFAWIDNRQIPIN